MNSKTVWSVLILMLTIRCAPQAPEDQKGIDKIEVRALNIHERAVSTQDFANLVKAEDHCYVFLTTDWCGGGKLWLNNSLLPNINRINRGDTPLFMAYMGYYNKLGLIADSLLGDKTLTIYRISDAEGSNALMDRWAIKKLLKQIDPELKYSVLKDGAPVRIEFQQNKAKYLKKSFEEL